MTVHRSHTKAYDLIARILHWLVALLVTVQFIIAWTMPDIHRGTAPTGLIGWHLSVGALIIAVMVLRIARRITYKPIPAEVPARLRRVAGASHMLLYILLIAVPFAGWANASSRGWRVALFNLIPYPPIAPQGSATGHILGDIHGWMAWMLFVVIVLHIAAALFHRFVLRDQILQRML